MKQESYIYTLMNAVYVNLTNRCPNKCAFCIREGQEGINGHGLWLKSVPKLNELIQQFEEITKGKSYSNEVTFCGFGEPTYELELLKGFAAYLKKNGYKTRLNTNGLGDLINGHSIAAELKNIDVISISLNQSDAQKYHEITKTQYGLDAYPAIIKFAKDCVNCGIDTVLTVVDTISKQDIFICEKIAKNIGARFRIRTFIPDNY